MFNPFIYT